MIKVNGQQLTRENWRELLKPKNLSFQEQIDIAGELSEARKFLQICEDFVKESIKNARDDEEWEDHGLHYQAIKTKKTREALDTRRVKEEMGEEWFKEHCKVTEYFELRITRIPNGDPE